MALALSPAYLKYLEGELADKLEDTFKDDGTPHGGAYEDKLQFVIQTYCQQHDQAGEQTAEFVRQIPFNAEFGIEGAVGGLMILKKTRAALAQLLEHDAEFLASYRGEHVTSEETDRSVRSDAREFTKRNEVDSATNKAITESATEGEATEEEVMDAAYNFQNGAEVEFDVALSARDRLEPKEGDEEDASAPAAASTNADPVSKADAPPASPEERAAAVDAVHAGAPIFSVGGLTVGESPRRDASQSAPAVQAPPNAAPELPSKIAIRVQSQFGTTPSIAFNRAKEWLANMIVSVAAGSEAQHSFPRIRPLIDKPELAPHATTQAELETLAREIKDMTRRLRPPLSESHGELMNIFERLKDVNPANMDEIKDVLGSFGEMFGNRKEDEFGLGLDGWKSGKDDDQ